MNDENIWGVVGFIVLVYMGMHIHSLNKKVEILQSTIDDCSSAVDEANDNIDSLNSSIEDAQGYTWSDYDEMGYALDNLQTNNTVSNPCSYSSE
jgi:hypothetical protein